MDWYVWLAPLLLLPIVGLFRLVGCGLDETGDGGPSIRSIVVVWNIPPFPLADYTIRVNCEVDGIPKTAQTNVDFKDEQTGKLTIQLPEVALDKKVEVDCESRVFKVGKQFTLSSGTFSSKKAMFRFDLEYEKQGSETDYVEEGFSLTYQG